MLLPFATTKFGPRSTEVLEIESTISLLSGFVFVPGRLIVPSIVGVDFMIEDIVIRRLMKTVVHDGDRTEQTSWKEQSLFLAPGAVCAYVFSELVSLEPMSLDGPEIYNLRDGDKIALRVRRFEPGESSRYFHAAIDGKCHRQSFQSIT
jgi:hypothetical protein